MISAAFKEAERARKRFRPVSEPQRRALASLSRKAGIELPQVRNKAQASDALTRLEDLLARPQLDGFSEALRESVEVRR